MIRIDGDMMRLTMIARSRYLNEMDVTIDHLHRRLIARDTVGVVVLLRETRGVVYTMRSMDMVESLKEREKRVVIRTTAHIIQDCSSVILDTTCCRHDG